MKVCLVTAHLSRAAGGLNHSVPGLALALEKLDHCESYVVGVTDRLNPLDHREWGTNVHAHNQYGPQAFGWAPAISTTLYALSPHIIDAQGLWMYPALATLQYAKRTGCPYVITPRGMLDPWALARSDWKKRLVCRWFQGAHLRGAACIRALAGAEVQAIHACGLRNPVALVPNGVDLPGRPPTRDAHVGLQTLLFLGRIDPKKGISELLQAWALVQSDARDAAWRLQLTGWGDPSYVARMRRLAADLALDPAAFVITGPQYGDAKAQAFRDAAAFILPSYSEGLPMAVLEAWSYGLPALLTDDCNLPDGFRAGAALRIEIIPRSIANGIRDMIHMGDARRSVMGEAGRSLVEQRFTWPIVARQMREVYAWILGGGSPPPCVLMD